MNSNEYSSIERNKRRKKLDYSLQDIPVFVINLPKSIDRRDFMRAQCEDIGFSPIFIDAVNGKELSEFEVSRYCNQKSAKQLFGRELLLGEIGCALSHIRIYKKIVDEHIPYAIILEDDAIIKENFNKAVELILASETNWELTLLGHNKGFDKGREFDSIRSFWGNIQLNNDFVLARIAKGGLGAFGYIISNNGAKKLLQHINFEKIIFPIDKITSNQKAINVYGLLPSIVTVDLGFKSMIENDGFRGNDRQGKLVYEIAKLIRKTPFFNLAENIWFTVLKVKFIKRYK